MNLTFWKKKFLEQGAFAKNSAVLFVGTMLASVLNYVFHLAIGRMVSAQTYGEAEALISLVTIVSVPAMTLTMVATKYSAACSASDDRKGGRKIFSYLNRNVFKYSLPVFLLAALITPYVGSFLNIEHHLALVLLWLSMFLSFFSAINSGVLRGWQRFRDISYSSVWGTAIKLFFGIVLVKIGFDLNGIVGSFVLGNIAIYAITLIALKFIWARKDEIADTYDQNAIDFKELKRYILPAFIGNLAITILGNADMVLAKHNLGALEAGQYGALTVVSKIIFFATGIIASVLFSMSAENAHRGNSSRQILLTGLMLVLGASACATLIYFLYPSFILGILFGNKYQDVAPYLGWFAVAVTLFSISNVVFQYLLSIHRTKISYAFLAVAGLLVGAVFFYGRSIQSILSMVIISQIAAVIISALFLSEGKLYNKKY